MTSTITEGASIQEETSRGVDVSGLEKIEQAKLFSRTEDDERLSNTQKSNQESKGSSNPILLVFRAMRIAKSILRDGLKETKRDNKCNERNWEKVSQEISAEHKKSQKSQQWNSYIHVIPPFLQLLGAQGGISLKGKDNTWWAGKEQTFTTVANYFPQVLGMRGYALMVPGAINNFSTKADIDKTVEDFTGYGIKYVQGYADSSVQQISLTNQADTTPLAMRSQAAGSLHQNRGSDESSEKQQLGEVDRSMRDLMSQEAQIFQGSSGRG